MATDRNSTIGMPSSRESSFQNPTFVSPKSFESPKLAASNLAVSKHSKPEPIDGIHEVGMAGGHIQEQTLMSRMQAKLGRLG